MEMTTKKKNTLADLFNEVGEIKGILSFVRDYEDKQNGRMDRFTEALEKQTQTIASLPCRTNDLRIARLEECQDRINERTYSENQQVRITRGNRKMQLTIVAISCGVTSLIWAINTFVL
jgi:Flp pilus assembly protein TadB